MDTGKVYVKKYSSADSALLSTVNRAEALRYAGYYGIERKDSKNTESSVEQLYRETVSDLLPLCSYQLCYAVYDISWENGLAVLPFPQSSKDLAKCLEGCSKIILFSATAGIGIDRYIMRQELISPSHALMAQALGAERVEALCDTFCSQMRDICQAENETTTPRFSPGFGDLSLSVQKDFFQLLSISKNIGISLSDSLLMKPSKSVTAIIGIKNNERT